MNTFVQKETFSKERGRANMNGLGFDSTRSFHLSKQWVVTFQNYLMMLAQTSLSLTFVSPAFVQLDLGSCSIKPRPSYYLQVLFDVLMCNKILSLLTHILCARNQRFIFDAMQFHLKLIISHISATILIQMVGHNLPWLSVHVA